jgi:methane/ammonia monooxygenase subunit B
VLKVKPVDSHDLVASEGLRVEDGMIDANATKEIKVFAEDALWETYRLTSLIYDPDSRFAGMLFFFGDNGDRFHTEVGGPMLPVFM